MSLNDEDWDLDSLELPSTSAGTNGRAAAFRPIHRPPMAILMVFDDGRSTGELVRLRTDMFVIGRSEGNCLIPHDPQIAPKHLIIQRELISGTYRWKLIDLASPSGLLIRVRRFKLAADTEFLAGGHRYRFSLGKSVHPQLLQMGEASKAVSLDKPVNWLGRGPQCDLQVTDDPFLGDRHVQITQSGRGWEIRTDGVTNGMWVRVSEMIVHKTCTFQIGEQRMRLYTDLSKLG